jgi:hypothetical protein
MKPSAFVVVAADRQPGPPRVRVAGEKWRRGSDDATWEPVGVRHAVRISDARRGQRRTLCGVPADEWHIWTDLELGSHGGDCRRCTQMMRG